MSIALLLYRSISSSFSTALRSKTVDATIIITRPAAAFRTYHPPLLTSLLTTRDFSKTTEAKEAFEAHSSKSKISKMSDRTIFDKIVAKEIPADIFHEDDLCVAFNDISPQGPVHFLVIPKNRDGLDRLSSAEERHKALLGHLLFTAQELAHKRGLVNGGFRTIINDGANAGQTVFHIHIHVIGGRTLAWPPG